MKTAQISAIALLLLALVLPSSAWADLRFTGQREPTGVFELKLGPYTPDIDSEFDSDGSYDTYFGNKTPIMLELEYDRQFWRGVGSFAAGVSVGYAGVKGKSVTESGEKSTDKTRLRLIPIRLMAIYRFDYLHTRFKVPLAFVVKGGLDYYFWFASSTGGVSDAENASGDLIDGKGGTAGFHGAFAIHFLLDFLAPNMASGFQGNVGVDNTYLFAELLVARVNDFGSKKSWNLSETTALFGLAFEF